MQRPIKISFQNEISDIIEKQKDASSSWRKFLDDFLYLFANVEEKLKVINERSSSVLTKTDYDICEKEWIQQAYPRIKISKIDVYLEYELLFSALEQLEYQLFECVFQTTTDKLLKFIKKILQVPKKQLSGAKWIGNATIKLKSIAFADDAKIGEILNCFDEKYKEYLKE